MRNFLSFLLLSSVVVSCSAPVNSIKQERTNSEVISISMAEALDKAVKLEKNSEDTTRDFVAIIEVDKFQNTVFEIEQSGGEILNSDPKIGYIHFASKASAAKALVDKEYFSKLTFDEKIESHAPKYKIVEGETPRAPRDLYSRDLMKINELKQELEGDGITLDGSSSTVAVFDTGLDISRTDVFQDRIVELRTMREIDNATLVDAEVELIDGVEYLVGTVNNQKISIIKSEKLSADRKYYIGSFTEEQFNSLNSPYEKVNDLNQDGAIGATFPVVASKNENGQFEVYINVNSNLVYGDLGDESIEDENMLMDFNWVSKNIKDRYHHDENNELNSYYKYTTRLDISKQSKSEEVTLLSDRNKGVLNTGVTIEEGKELKDGELVNIEKNENLPAKYNIGLVGYDLGGHGTHCAGIAAGNFTAAPQFSSGAYNAKIAGVTMLGDGYSYASFMNTMQKVRINNPNTIFSFSFGGNIAANKLGGSTMTKFYDKITTEYGNAIVKAAGNEGPGVNSHGISTSKWVLDVANFYSTTSRNTYATGGNDLGTNKILVSSSSSRGPMIDGALKPDIGAPGWVMSTIPLKVNIGESKKAFEYWPGTSMATPNAASVIALLYDAAVKKDIKSQNTETAPFNIVALHKALKNSALEYDDLTIAECRAKGSTACKMEKKTHEFSWIEGGAGRINAVGAWKVLQNVVNDPFKMYATKVNSRMAGYEGWALGLYGNDILPSASGFYLVDESPEGDLSELTNVQSFILKSTVDWISFDNNHTQKERIVELVPGEYPFIKFYIDKSKLLENGKLKPGVHTTTLKAFNFDNDEYFDWVFPITLVGLDTNFDEENDNGIFSVQGFIPSDQFARYTIPVDEDQSTLLLDLHTSAALPGSVKLTVYYEGIELDLYNDYGIKNPWAKSDGSYMASMNTSNYVLPNLKKGVYEVVVHASSYHVYDYEGELGSFYDLNVSRLSLSVDSAKEYRNTKISKVVLNNIKTERKLVVDKFETVLDSFRMNKEFSLKNKEKLEIPITLNENYRSLFIASDYTGIVEKMDIDIVLKDQAGAVVGKSEYPSSRERIFISAEQGIPAGEYILEVAGFNIPDESDLFNIEITQTLKNKLVLGSTFTDRALNKNIKSGSELNPDIIYNFTGIADLTLLNGIDIAEGFKPLLRVDISAKYGRNGESSNLFSQILE